jgi:hypothetical protein
MPTPASSRRLAVATMHMDEAAADHVMTKHRKTFERLAK